MLSPRKDTHSLCSHCSHLSSADIAGRLVTPYVLLTGLQGQPVAVLVVRVPERIKNDILEKETYFRK